MITSTIAFNNPAVGTSLTQLLNADDIQPGTEPGYQTCKTIYLFHPLGAKMAESPLKMAQAKRRIINVPDGPEDRCVKQFEKEWEAINAEKVIFQTAALARVYGIASVGIMSQESKTDEPIDLKALWKDTIAFNVFDPLNTAGSLVLNQNTDAMDFMKVTDIVVNGKRFHRSRAAVILHEQPVYIAYTSSGFGFVGRSVYQRALYPLKSFIQTMITDDLVTLKAGVLVAKIKQPGSIVDNLMQKMFGLKRELLKQAEVGNVLSIAPEEEIESLNFQNLDGPYALVRANILKNIATSADMPAVMLENETLTEGFGEGTEDAKNIAKYIDGVRTWLKPLYDFFDRIVMHRAWNPDFYKTIVSDFPEQYGSLSYEQAFYRWSNSFAPTWPDLLTEPPSKKVEVDKIKLEAIVSMLQAIGAKIDPENYARLIEWAQDNFNDLDELFTNPLELDFKALADWTPPVAEQGAGKPTLTLGDSDRHAQPRMRVLSDGRG